MYAARYGGGRRPIGQSSRSVADVAWETTWPFITTTLIAILMIICIIIIFSLEIASLAKGTAQILFGNTSATGAGIWCGLFFTIAAVLILLIDCMRSIRLWATIALIATIIALCFAVILLGLDAKAVQDGTGSFFGLSDKGKILGAQLAFTILELILCLLFIGLYIAVLIIAPRRLRRR